MSKDGSYGNRAKDYIMGGQGTVNASFVVTKMVADWKRIGGILAMWEYAFVLCMQ